MNIFKRIAYGLLSLGALSIAALFNRWRKAGTLTKWVAVPMVIIALLVGASAGYRAITTDQDAFAASAAFDDSNWTGYFEVTSDNTQVDNANDNLMIDLGAQAPAEFWSNVAADGGDIRITNDAGDTAYSFELENFDRSGETGIVFFDSSILSTSSDTTWRVYAGNGSASLPAEGDTLGAHNVWNNNYAAVYHMNQEPTSNTALKDSTSNNNDSTEIRGSMTSGDLIDGELGKAVAFDGGDDEIDVGDIGITEGTHFTVSAWARVADADKQDNPTVYNEFNPSTGGGENQFVIYYADTLTSGDEDARFFKRDDTNTTANFNDSANYADGTWRQLIARENGNSEHRIYVDPGGFTAQDTTSVNTLSVTESNIGHNSGGQNYPGDIDELRLSTTALSENWLTTEYNNQSSPTTFWTTGAWTEVAGAPTGRINIFD